MRNFLDKMKLVAVLVVTGLLVALGILNLRDRLSAPPIADDGVEWVDTTNGVMAKAVKSYAHISVRAEHILSDKSSVEVMAFFDTVSGHGVGLLAIPVDRIEDDPTFSTAQQKGRARGLRVVYNRRINNIFDSSFGYAFGEGQQLDGRAISEPANLFSNAAFQVFSARVNAHFVKSGTRISTVLRIAPKQAIFAIDPFQGQMTTYDPNLSLSLTQSLPDFGILPGHWEVIADLRNLLDQQASIADETQQLISSRYNRLVRVGVSMRF